MHVLKEYPYKLLEKYPGMRPKDVIIWDEFIKNNPDTFDKVWYDVHIGEPTERGHTKDEMIASGAYEVSQWCVDVLAMSSFKHFVIELRPGALAGALGQALAYRAILQAEGRIEASAQAVVITDEIIPITEHAAALLGVSLLIP